MKKSSPKSLTNKINFIRFSTANISVVLLLSVLYFCWFIYFLGLRSEHIFLYFLALFTYFGTPKTRLFIKAFSIFIVYWIIFDSMKLLPNYKVNPIHIQEPYEIEKHFFGLSDNGIRVTLNEYFVKYHTKFLDFLSGIFYLHWIPLPLGFGIYLFLKDLSTFYRLAYCFVFVNFIGFAIYYLYPAAPPWYVALYGYEVHFNTKGNIANLKYFDEMINYPLFKGIYEKSSNVFAAMPSLHSAYPLIVLYYGIQKHLKIANIYFATICLGIWFSAVYSGHHYVIDVLCGIFCALLGIFLFEKFLWKEIKKLV